MTIKKHNDFEIVKLLRLKEPPHEQNECSPKSRDATEIFTNPDLNSFDVYRDKFKKNQYSICSRKYNGT